MSWCGNWSTEVAEKRLRVPSSRRQRPTTWCEVQPDGFRVTLRGTDLVMAGPG